MNKMYATCVSSMHLFDSRSPLRAMVPNFGPGSARPGPRIGRFGPQTPNFPEPDPRFPDPGPRPRIPGFPGSQESGFLPKKGPGPQELTIPDPQPWTPENGKNAKNTKKPKNTFSFAQNSLSQVLHVTEAIDPLGEGNHRTSLSFFDVLKNTFFLCFQPK